MSGLLLFATVSRSDVGHTQSSAAATGPGTGTGTGPNAHGHRHAGPMHPGVAPTRPDTVLPPTQNDPGAPGALWKYEQLTPAEQAYIDNVSDPTGWERTNAAFTSAVGEQSNAAAANAAASKLGIDNLAEEGVVR